jgi:hemerythrin
MATLIAPLFTWKDEYCVHNAEIDTQHKKLVALLNSLHEGMMAGKSQQQLEHLLGELVQYTVVHFAAEERLMQRSNYPEYKGHKQIHEDLTRQVGEFQSKFRSGRVALSIELLQFLKSWLRHHIQGSDQEFGRFLATRK